MLAVAFGVMKVVLESALALFQHDLLDFLFD